MNDEQLQRLLGNKNFEIVREFGGAEVVALIKEKFCAAVQRSIERPDIPMEQQQEEFRAACLPILARVVTEMKFRQMAAPKKKARKARHRSLH